ncbi:hypothetical protein ACTJI2_12550 [Pseudoxanthomonas sp. 22568]|uniref:hypothetical protein n=1 Tax=Pseudoxanthomonas sp. 22568 TaxID=3453945 RepID=UPI003F877207
MIRPPATSSTTPVIHDEASLGRNRDTPRPRALIDFIVREFQAQAERFNPAG